MNSKVQADFLSALTDADVKAFRESGAFDEKWYLEQYPDVKLSGIDPAKHYLWIGRRLDRRPSAGATSMTTYLPETGASVDASERLVAIQTATPQDEGHSGRDLVDPAVLRLVSAHFDKDYYLSTYPDIEAAGVDPIEHYLTTGWTEGRDPALSFSTRYYLENNADVASAQVNPFYHYLAAGKKEGREAKHKLGFRWDVLAELPTVPEQIALFKKFRTSINLSPTSGLQNALTNAVGVARKVVLSFSHDDFTLNVGGVQLLLRRELDLILARGDAHVHIFPAHNLPFLETSNEKVALGIIINGQLAGYFHGEQIAAAIASAGVARKAGAFIIHSLLGQSMDDTMSLIAAAGMDKGYLWLHDYSPIYNNFKLLRNDVAYNGYPKEGTVARELCTFAAADFSHAEQFSRLLSRFSIDLLSPSQAALDIWNDANVLKVKNQHVVEHLTLREISQEAPGTNKERPLRIGFLGYPAHHKGWPVFQNLVVQFADDPRYEFYHLGKQRRGGLNLQFREVAASEVEPDLMRKAVAAAEIDVALMWSIWPETFCLAAYEALAGGAAILTNPDAGNVASLVVAGHDGMILPDEAALAQSLERGDLTKFSRSARTVRHFAMDYSAVTLEVMD